MELTAQPIHSLFLVIANTWPDWSLSCFCSQFVLDDLQTVKVIKSGISSEAFAIFPLWKFRAETPHVFGIPNCITPTPYLQNSSPNLVQEIPSPLSSLLFHFRYFLGCANFFFYGESITDYFNGNPNPQVDDASEVSLISFLLNC